MTNRRKRVAPRICHWSFVIGHWSLVIDDFQFGAGLKALKVRPLSAKCPRSFIFTQACPRILRTLFGVQALACTLKAELQTCPRILSQMCRIGNLEELTGKDLP